MAADPNFRIDRELQEHLMQLQGAVLRGDAADWADYKYLCGQICGITFAMQVLADARNEAIREEGLE